MKLRGRSFITELIISFGVLLTVTSITVELIDPLHILYKARDLDRVTAISELNTQFQAITTLEKAPPHCNEMSVCPADFSLTGQDGVSLKLMQSKRLNSIPVPPEDAASSMCDYHVYLFPKEENTYLLRWCFESWTEDDVEKTKSNSSYLCSWQQSDKVAVCFVGGRYEMPTLE